MKTKFLISLMTIVSVLSAEVRPGLEVLAGGRFDNLRMCVATPQGTKGGPMADAALMLSISGNKLNGGVKIPLFRPILFGAAFKMVQFEPEAFLRFPLGTEKNWAILPGAGISVHYGPDYLSDRKNRSESFWAAGPIASVSILHSVGKKNTELGLRPFVTVLFGENNRRGFVTGCSFEYLHQF